MKLIKLPPLCCRRKSWTLTWSGWVVLLVTLIIYIVVICNNLYSFLSVQAPLPQADVLVVEGWLPDYGVEAAIAEFEKNSYQKIITTGLPLSLGFYLAEYKTFAELSAASFQALGFNSEQLVAVPGPKVRKDRTYYSAIALRDWLSNSELEVNSINLFSFGPHTRRSLLLFKKALEPTVKVGAIAVDPLEYDPENWWQSSEGVRSIISETIAYTYARFLWKRE